MTSQEIVDISTRIYKGNSINLNRLLNEFVNETGITEIHNTLEPIEYFQRKFHTVLLTNKNNQFLKAFNYEEIINPSVCSCEENSSECKSFSSEEE